MKTITNWYYSTKR